MKFLRHLAAVVLVVAVIVGLGMLWAHASAGGGGLRRPPSAQVVQRLKEIKGGVIPVQAGTGFESGDTQNLIRTCEIEAVLAAAVITVSAIKRRHRRARRLAR